MSVPTGALLPITNTVLLTCRYPTFVDGSASPITLTNVGTATTNTANPFPTSVLPNPALGGAGNGIYTMTQYNSLLSAGTWPAYDPYYENVTLNLHGNAGTVLPFNTDASTNNFQVTQVGNTSPSNYTPFITNGYWSNYFDGDSDKIYTPSNAAFVMGSGDFTVEAWVYRVANPKPYSRIFNFGPYYSSNDSWALNFDDGAYPGKITFSSFKLGGRLCVSSTTVSSGVWYHVAATRASGVFRLFVNGTLESTNSSFVGTTIEASSTNICCVASAYDRSAEEDFNAYVSNARVVKGTAVYTASFTPSTTPLTAISGTSLLTCQSNRFVDNSTNSFALTIGGSPSVNPLQTIHCTDWHVCVWKRIL